MHRDCPCNGVTCYDRNRKENIKGKHVPCGRPAHDISCLLCRTLQIHIREKLLYTIQYLHEQVASMSVTSGRLKVNLWNSYGRSPCPIFRIIIENAAWRHMSVADQETRKTEEIVLVMHTLSHQCTWGRLCLTDTHLDGTKGAWTGLSSKSSWAVKWVNIEQQQQRHEPSQDFYENVKEKTHLGGLLG